MSETKSNPPGQLISIRGMRPPSLIERRLVSEALAIEQESAREAGMLGYMARVLVQTTLPHSKQPGVEYVRRNGNLTISIMAPSLAGGLPYGSTPRMLLAWLTTEAVRTQSPELHLGQSLSEFMCSLHLTPTGGRRGSITSLRDQAERLFSSTVSVFSDDAAPGGGRFRQMRSINVVSEAATFWRPQSPTQRSIWKSVVVLTHEFYRQVVDRPVPIDLRAISALRKSPMALDLYAWTTYRAHHLSKTVIVPWEALQMQFGVGYPETAQGRSNFKGKLLSALRKVCHVYPALRVDEKSAGLELRPSPTHVPAMPRKRSR